MVTSYWVPWDPRGTDSSKDQCNRHLDASSSPGKLGAHTHSGSPRTSPMSPNFVVICTFSCRPLTACSGESGRTLFGASCMWLANSSRNHIYEHKCAEIKLKPVAALWELSNRSSNSIISMLPMFESRNDYMNNGVLVLHSRGTVVLCPLSPSWPLPPYILGQFKLSLPDVPSRYVFFPLVLLH